MKNSKLKALALILAAVMVSSSGCIPMMLASSNKRAAEKKEDRRDKDDKDKDDKDDKDKKDDKDAKDKSKADGGTIEYDKRFGTYSLPEDWVEVPEHSQEPNYYSYAFEGTENDGRPNNIAVAYGDQPYGEDEFDEFKNAILSNLAGQIGDKDVEIHSSGTTTSEGNVLLTVELLEENATTIQYYVLGEKKFVMISAAIYDYDAAEEDNIKAVAFQIADQFVWKD